MCSGQHVAQLHMFRRSLCVHVLSLALLSILCSHLGCVEPLPISLGTETFPSSSGLCDASPASDFDIGFSAAFVHLNMRFACLSIS